MISWYYSPLILLRYVDLFCLSHQPVNKIIMLLPYSSSLFSLKSFSVLAKCQTYKINNKPQITAFNSRFQLLLQYFNHFRFLKLKAVKFSFRTLSQLFSLYIIVETRTMADKLKKPAKTTGNSTCLFSFWTFILGTHWKWLTDFFNMTLSIFCYVHSWTKKWGKQWRRWGENGGGLVLKSCCIKWYVLVIFGKNTNLGH